MKTYGPYQRKDGRSHVIHYENGKRRTQSYPRFMMELELGRELLPEEHVDHINNDATDNRIENLQILTVVENNRKSQKPAEMGTFICPVCGKEFELFMRQYRGNQLKQGKQGPYCSKSCNGKVNN